MPSLIHPLPYLLPHTHTFSLWVLLASNVEVPAILQPEQRGLLVARLPLPPDQLTSSRWQLHTREGRVPRTSAAGNRDYCWLFHSYWWRQTQQNVFYFSILRASGQSGFRSASVWKERGKCCWPDRTTTTLVVIALLGVVTSRVHVCTVHTKLWHDP